MFVEETELARNCVEQLVNRHLLWSLLIELLILRNGCNFSLIKDLTDTDVVHVAVLQRDLGLKVTPATANGLKEPRVNRPVRWAPKLLIFAAILAQCLVDCLQYVLEGLSGIRLLI